MKLPGFYTINLIILLLLVRLSFDLYAQDEIYLKIQSEGFKKIDLVIEPMQSEVPSLLTTEIRNVLINDLTLSGFFRLYDEFQFTPLADNDSRNKTMITGARIETQLKFNSAGIVLNVILTELPTNLKIFNKDFDSKVESARFLAHQVSDEIVYYLIGEKGVTTTRIAYVKEQGQAKEIVVIDYDGHDFEQLTFSKSLNLSPRWSPAGDRIAFTSYIMENPDLLIFPLKDRTAYRLSSQPGLNTAPAWSPDGKKIALTLTIDKNPELYSIDVKGGKLRRLTDHPAIDSSPSWSPDGREIVFTSDRTGTPQVYLMDSQGGNVRRLTFEGGYNDSPAWSPRGDRIAYVSRDEGQFNIYTINVIGEELKKLTDGPGNNENPSWSPDGLKLAFASNRDKQWDIYVMNWDGSQLRRVTQDGGNKSPAWSPRLNYD
ncbi:Tol-Pal system beta propeller repeat protein TolB [candidate division KSB1 bacterium]|nr:Tol-Pal system beta propeller repeat protein TolB [candidate division KSB1 bacterium]